jgi:hypothetical protein
MLVVPIKVMWDSLSIVQPIADSLGFGEQWSTMLIDRSVVAARNAANAAYDAADAIAATAAADVWELIDPCGLLEKLIGC